MVSAHVYILFPKKANAVYIDRFLSGFNFFLINLFIYFWLHWVFAAACSLSLVVASGGFSRCGAQALGVQASHCGGFSCCGAWALGVRASVVVARGL